MKKILITLCTIIFIFLIWFMFTKDDRDYNNGVCRKCNGHYTAINYTFDRMDGKEVTTLKCDDCGNIINVATGIVKE